MPPSPRRPRTARSARAASHRESHDETDTFTTTLLLPQHTERDPAAQRLPGLPLGRLQDRVKPTGNCSVVTTIDINGRLADRSPVEALSWPAGLPVSFTLILPLLVVGPDTTSREHVTSQGYLRLSSSIRRVLQIVSGDRLYVTTAGASVGQLTICPVWIVDDFIERFSQERIRTVA
jgi:hypothetical protein